MAPKRKRGASPNYRRGVQQRTQELESSEQPSVLRALLLQKFYGGALSAKDVRDICQAASKDGLRHSEVR
eukprot:6004638-Amphidinium_carterae.1